MFDLPDSSHRIRNLCDGSPEGLPVHAVVYNVHHPTLSSRECLKSPRNQQRAHAAAIDLFSSIPSAQLSSLKDTFLTHAARDTNASSYWLLMAV
jgi:hypothetical protein